MTILINQNNSFDGLFSFAMEKTLYHGTTIDNAKKIAEEGMWPQTGGFTSQFYGDEYAGEDENGEDVYNETKLEELIFAADKEEVSKALTAMVAQIGVKLGKDMHSVTDEEILRYGALVVIREGGWERRPHEDKDYRWEMEHEDGSHGHVEPGDYYSGNHESFSYILTGNKMMSILRQLGEIPRKWGPNEKENKRELLIKYVRQSHPEVSIDKIIERIDSFDSKDFRKYYNLYIPKEVRFK